MSLSQDRPARGAGLAAKHSGIDLDPALKARLLASVEADRLVIVCGAGLSMAEPSCLPSARSVAHTCYDKYRLSADPECNPALRDDLEALADHFVALGTLGFLGHNLIRFIEEVLPARFGGGPTDYSSPRRRMRTACRSSSSSLVRMSDRSPSGRQRTAWWTS